MLTKHGYKIILNQYQSKIWGNPILPYYVSGYIGRSISRRRKFLSCKELLIQFHEINPQDVEMSPEYKALFELADRGGLSAPSEYCFAITAFAVQYYITIAMNDSIMHRLLMCSNQRNTFVNAVTKRVQSSEILQSLFHIQCSAKHTKFKLIFQSVFNCCAKNQLKRINSRPNLPDPPSKAMRCIKKLTGKSSSDPLLHCDNLHSVPCLHHLAPSVKFYYYLC